MHPRYAESTNGGSEGSCGITSKPRGACGRGSMEKNTIEAGRGEAEVGFTIAWGETKGQGERKGVGPAGGGGCPFISGDVSKLQNRRRRGGARFLPIKRGRRFGTPTITLNVTVIETTFAPNLLPTRCHNVSIGQATETRNLGKIPRMLLRIRRSDR